MSDTDGDSPLSGPAVPGQMAAGAAVIADYLPRLPHAPGVYRMMAHNGDLLYVGKAAKIGRAHV